MSYVRKRVRFVFGSSLVYSLIKFHKCGIHRTVAYSARFACRNYVQIDDSIHTQLSQLCMCFCSVLENVMFLVRCACVCV